MRPAEMESAVRGYFAAYEAGDRAAFEAALHPDFTFTSPYDDHIGIGGYFERCWGGAGQKGRLALIEVQAGARGCFAFYRGRSGATAFRNIEYFTFEQGRLRAVEVFFGLAEGETPRTPGAEANA